MIVRVGSIALFVLVAFVSNASAQLIGVFGWQTKPYCNVISVAVTQNGSVYRLEGTDNQCGAPTAAGVTGVAFPNPNGTIGFALTIIGTPGGSPVTVDGTITLPTLNGTWRDSAGGAGDFTFTPGAGAPGPARPITAPGVHFRTPGQLVVQAIPNGSQVHVTYWSANPESNLGGGVYDGATGRYTVPAAGLYSIITTVRWQAFAAAAGRRCVLIEVGLLTKGNTCEVQSTTAEPLIQQVATELLLNQGDAVGVSVFQNSGSPGTLSGASSTFIVTRLR